MRRLFVVPAMVAAILALVVQTPAASSAGANDQEGQPAPSGQDLGTPGALGQSVSRPPAPTGPAPRLSDGAVDLNGVWIGGGPVGDLAAGLPEGEELPLLPWARELRDSRKVEDDPHNYCLPMGPIRSTPYPWRFVQNYTHTAPTHLFMLHEGNIHSFRQIFMDGREHPDDLDPTWYGHSVGWWEGDTLVIETVGLNGKFWFDRQGTPHTEQLRTVERWTRTDFGTLVNEVTIDDPGTFSRPFTVTFRARLSSPDDELMEYICQENNQFGVAGGHANPYMDHP